MKEEDDGVFFSQSKEKKKNVEKEGSLPFFSRICIWDEALLSTFFQR
jgi:hypothetical protein